MEVITLNAPTELASRDRRGDLDVERIRRVVLVEADVLLAHDVDPRAVLRRIAELIVPTLADRFTAYLRGAGALDRVVERGERGERAETWPDGSQLVVPLVARDRVLGVLALVRAGEPCYDLADLGFVEQLARRLAVRVVRAPR
ncbi:MAG: GAF domain-containing protein [Kofleriaceae bacterium]